VTTDATNTTYQDGYVRKPTGELLVSATPASPTMIHGLVRDGVTGALAVVQAAPVAGRQRGFTLDASGYLYTTALV
jgi:hypothetical protein